MINLGAVPPRVWLALAMLTAGILTLLAYCS